MSSPAAIQKHHGIDFEYLSRQDVLEDSCFWNLVQCQKDSLYYFSVTTEKQLLKRASRLIKKKAAKAKDTKEHPLQVVNEHNSVRKGSKSLLLLRDEVVSLREFLEYHEDAFVRVLHAYDDTHDTNIYQVELDDLKETHTFLDGARLELIFHQINQSINGSAGPSHKVWKKQRTSLNLLKNLHFGMTKEEPRSVKQASIPFPEKDEEDKPSKKIRSGSMRSSLSSIFSFGKK